MGGSDVGGGQRGRAPKVCRPDGALSGGIDDENGNGEGAGTETTNGDATEDLQRPGDGAASSVSDDDLFEVLYNPRRQQVVRYLREHDGTATAGELAEQIAADETDKSLEGLTSYERKRVYVSLYQNHLPVMDEANVIDYDEDRKEVRLRDAASKLNPYLDDEPSMASADWRVASATALSLGLVVLLGTLQVGLLGAVPVAGWAVLGAASLLVLAGFNVYQSRCW